jgi:predicted DNA-binding protein
MGRGVKAADFWTSEKGQKVLKELSEFQGVIFDEVSFAGLELMEDFFFAMNALRDQKHPMHVILVGDMYQLPPVQQTHLLTVVGKVERCQLRHLTDEMSLKYQSVSADFLRLQRYQFTKQMRSVDDVHSRNLTTMRGPNPFVRRDLLADYELLKKADFMLEKWRMCHIGVRTNAEREHLIRVRAPAIAQELNTCVLRWLNPIRKGRNEFESDFRLLQFLAKTMPAVESLYVYQASCMLLENINPAKQLANGTRGKFWGIVWKQGFDLAPGETPPYRFREGGGPMTGAEFVGCVPGSKVWVPPPIILSCSTDAQTGASMRWLCLEARYTDFWPA